MHRSIFVAVMVVSSASIGSAAMAQSTDLKARADALLARSFDAKGPGVAVAISQHGRIVYQGQRGEADIAANRPVTEATVFRLGSITKQKEEIGRLAIAFDSRCLG